MPKEKHPVNVLFTRAEHSRLVRWATELTLQEGRRVSVAELVRRLTVSNGNGSHEGMEGSGAGADSS